MSGAKNYEKRQYRWNADDYARHSEAQQAWARELTAKLALTGDEELLDIGCGDGKVTAELAALVPQGSVVGLDSSEAMIGLASSSFPSDRYPNLTFIKGDARRLHFSNRFDRIFSNAALHWVLDHRPVLAGMFQALRSGGLVVAQMGGLGNAAGVVSAVDALVRQDAWQKFFADFSFPYGFYGPDEYEPWLEEAGFAIRTIELIAKDMVHNDRQAFTGWVRTTWLPYIDRVPENLRERFIDGVVDKYLASHPSDNHGAVHTAMQRLEFVAGKS